MPSLFIPIDADELVLCRSDNGDGGWSLHAPGSTDQEIADGTSLCLASGEAPGPSKWDRAIAVRAYAGRAAPWSAELIEVEGGFRAFVTVADYLIWEKQI
jgi:hypothetical protein